MRWKSTDFFFFSLFYKLQTLRRLKTGKQFTVFAFLLQIMLWKLTLSVVSLLVAGEATDKENSNSRIILEVVRAFFAFVLTGPNSSLPWDRIGKLNPLHREKED